MSNSNSGVHCRACLLFIVYLIVIRCWSRLGTLLGHLASEQFFYYNQVLGLPPAACGVAVFIALFSDAVIDPVVGYVSDNYVSKRWGRRHGFLLLSIVPVTVSMWLLFHPWVHSGAGDTTAATVAWCACAVYPNEGVVMESPPPPRSSL